MEFKKVTLRCDDGAEAAVFTKYNFCNISNKTNDFSYEFCIEDDYIGGEYKGFLGRLKRAWRAFWDKPVVYTGIYCENKEKMRNFLNDCINLLIEDDEYLIQEDYDDEPLIKGLYGGE